jgi:hypothetical protein
MLNAVQSAPSFSSVIARDVITKVAQNIHLTPMGSSWDVSDLTEDRILDIYSSSTEPKNLEAISQYLEKYRDLNLFVYTFEPREGDFKRSWTSEGHDAAFAKKYNGIVIPND